MVNGAESRGGSVAGQVARRALQHGVVQLFVGQADQQRQAALDGVQGLAEGFELFFVAAIAFGRVGIPPVGGGRVAGPERAHLACGVVAHGDDEVHVGRAGGGKLVPAFAAQAFGRDASGTQHLQAQRVGLLVVARAAAGRKGLEAALPQMVEQGLGQDAAGGIVRAQKQHVQGFGCIGHGELTQKTWPLSSCRQQPGQGCKGRLGSSFQ